MIDLAQKKSDVGYQYKKDLFQTGNTAAEAAVKQKYDAAIAVARSDQEKAKLQQEKDLKLREIAAMNKPPAGIQVANMLLSADPNMSKPEALRQGFLITQGGDLKNQQLEATKVKAFEDARAKIETEWKKMPESMMRTSKDPKSIEKYNNWKQGMEDTIEKERKYIMTSGAGGLPQALLSPSGAAPSATPTAGGYTVMTGGKVFNFPTQAAADAFKQASGAK
jgi:hypothetical protein